MTRKILLLFCLVLMLPAPVRADVGRIVEPLPCGIYDQQARPFIEKDLETQSADPARYRMEMTTAAGRTLTAEVRNVSINLAGERNHVSVFVDGKLLAKTSHQDLPLYFEVHLDNVKYRIICLRTGPELWEEGSVSSGATETTPATR